MIKFSTKVKTNFSSFHKILERAQRQSIDGFVTRAGRILSEEVKQAETRGRVTGNKAYIPKVVRKGDGVELILDETKFSKFRRGGTEFDGIEGREEFKKQEKAKFGRRKNKSQTMEPVTFAEGEKITFRRKANKSATGKVLPKSPSQILNSAVLKAIKK